MNQLPSITLKPSKHHEKDVIQIVFERNPELQSELRTNTNMQWSKTMSCWYVPFSVTVKQELFKLLKNKAWIDYEALNSFAKSVPQKQSEALLKLGWSRC